MGKKNKIPAEILDPGWQFYPKPTTLDPPGTVFRIDDKGRRYIVDYLEVKTTKGKEASGKIVRSSQASVGLLASLFGVDKVGIGVKAKKIERLVFEIIDSVKEETTDVSIGEVLDPFRAKLDYRADNRYFIIRDTRMASAMKYILSEQLVNDISGGAAALEDFSVEGEFKRLKEGEYELIQEFDGPMRIMFLPEEIAPAGVVLGGGEPPLGYFKVTETLIWEEG
ncbi:MAG: hypothetical protein K9N55_10195 [Phycisphaerae bacterium]|nr:hypothetical protein [Phycisphaerae bacterium]